MDTNYILGIGVVAAIFAVLLVRQFMGKAPLPALPESGPLPVADLQKYYAINEAPLAWERVKGWDLNQVPNSWVEPAPIDHVVLTPTLLEFCSGQSGKLTLDFNFLVRAIQRVDFDPGALGGTPLAGVSAGSTKGLVTVYTPSGQTKLVATAGFANLLQQTVANAHALALAEA